ncbi:thiamine phosphate synthase [uncultured Eubacterium sp.]|uniref:thiamine phosphate synthase n=1 Tax=uncultured Eubacterium sp. TaxID=165185 RepID=UPI0025D42889|nr:thiamine phosphate synthase [uncultured Eubacterium sp.]
MSAGINFPNLTKQNLTFPLLAVSNRHLAAHPFMDQIERVCQAHPAALILREKDLPAEEYKALATRVLPLCQRYNVPCILHTFWQEALDIGCSSVHLPLLQLRDLAGNDGTAAEKLSGFSVIGTSVHSVDEALEAERLGATYLTSGHIYVTDCKKGLAPRGLKFLQAVCKSVSVPVYGIGGIKFDPLQWQELEAAGAAGGCIMSGMMEL